MYFKPSNTSLNYSDKKLLNFPSVPNDREIRLFAFQRMFGPSIKKIVLKSLSEKNIARVTGMSPVYRKNHNYECVRRTREA